MSVAVTTKWLIGDIEPPASVKTRNYFFRSVALAPQCCRPKKRNRFAGDVRCENSVSNGRLKTGWIMGSGAGLAKMSAVP